MPRRQKPTGPGLFNMIEQADVCLMMIERLFVGEGVSQELKAQLTKLVSQGRESLDTARHRVSLLRQHVQNTGDLL